VIASYVNGPNIDEPLSAEIRRDWIYYHADGLGSITALTSHMGNVVQKYEYDSFGNMSLKPHFIKQPYTYTGREFDPETGLYYYRARYYDTKAGRFISRDPIGFDGGDVNLYVYVGNNPINWIDPDGQGLIKIGMCFYYSVQISKYINACRKELEDLRKCKNSYPFEADIEFMLKYGGAYLSEATAYCAYEKYPNKNIGKKWLKNCFVPSLSPPAVPRR
jgi:RHS repeat-associated protein